MASNLEQAFASQVVRVKQFVMQPLHLIQQYKLIFSTHKLTHGAFCDALWAILASVLDALILTFSASGQCAKACHSFILS